ncbi:hypothetical protein MKX78_01570 [Cytobacillus sp. FSL R5-0569]|uniref:hypothetical protein n=1 Tax=unclassified Cytobacillus TaxID=2675268 RepID=UPI0030FD1993
MTIESIIIGVILIFIQLFALRIIKWLPMKEQKILSLSGGVAIAYVFVYILPSMHEEQDKLGGTLAIDSELYFLGLIGLIVYYSVYKFAKSTKAQKMNQNAAYFVQATFFAIYTFMVSYIVFSSDVHSGEALFYGLAIGLHFIGISYHIGKENEDIHHQYGRFLFAIATLIGALAGSMGPTTGLFVHSIIAFSSGAMIFNVISKELPEEDYAHLPTFLLASLLYSLILFTLKTVFNW